jgi:pyruvate kinase
LVSSYRPNIPITAVTNTIETARRVQLLPGVDSLVVEELDRGSLTMQGALSRLVKLKRILPGHKIVAISGSPKAISGVTSTARLYKVSQQGEIIGTE